MNERVRLQVQASKMWFLQKSNELHHWQDAHLLRFENL